MKVAIRELPYSMCAWSLISAVINPTMHMTPTDYDQPMSLYPFPVGLSGVYTKFFGRLSEEPFPWLIKKFPCILMFKIGQLGCQLNLSKGPISWIWRPLV